MDPIQIYPTTGALSVEVEDGEVILSQEDIHGGSENIIDIPVTLFPLVVQRVLEQLGEADALAVVEAAESVAGKGAA